MTSKITIPLPILRIRKLENQENQKNKHLLKLCNNKLMILKKPTGWYLPRPRRSWSYFNPLEGLDLSQLHLS